MSGISVIIPTLNRCKSLARTLECVVQQEFPVDQHEIVVVDNGSTDATRDAVNDVVQRHPQRRIKYVFEPYPSLLAGRHRGFREAEGEFLVFADDDIETQPDWLASIHETFTSDSAVAMVGGNVRPRFESTPPPWIGELWKPTDSGGRQLHYLALVEHPHSEPSWIDPTLIYGCNFAIRRSVLVEIGGFHPDGFYGALLRFLGDSEGHVTRTVKARGLKARFHPGASVRHVMPQSRMNIEYFARRAFTDGIRNSFTDIRAAGGLDSPKVSRRPRTLHSTVGDVVTPIFKALNQHSGWLVWREIWTAHRAGYHFHRREIKREPRLLAWVLRPDYWDYTIPIWLLQGDPWSYR